MPDLLMGVRFKFRFIRHLPAPCDFCRVTIDIPIGGLEIIDTAEEGEPTTFCAQCFYNASQMVLKADFRA